MLANRLQGQQQAGEACCREGVQLARIDEDRN